MPFQPFSSVQFSALSIFTMLCNIIWYLQNLFLSPQTVTLYPLSNTIYSLLLPAPGNQLSVSMNLTFLATVHLLRDLLVVYNFWLLWIMLLWMLAYKNLVLLIFSIALFSISLISTLISTNCVTRLWVLFALLFPEVKAEVIVLRCFFCSNIGF